MAEGCHGVDARMPERAYGFETALSAGDNSGRKKDVEHILDGRPD
jgi:hypothetical protein